MLAATLSRADEKSARNPDVKPPQKILHQSYFKSLGPRTYAAQVKEAQNGNHFILLTEGKRDKTTGDLHKTSLIVFSEDFNEFFKLVEDTARFVRAHPVPEEVARKQAKIWAKRKNSPRDQNSFRGPNSSRDQNSLRNQNSSPHQNSSRGR
jgi:hypothetical protein